MCNINGGYRASMYHNPRVGRANMFRHLAAGIPPCEPYIKTYSPCLCYPPALAMPAGARAAKRGKADVTCAASGGMVSKARDPQQQRQQPQCGGAPSSCDLMWACVSFCHAAVSVVDPRFLYSAVCASH